jgi:hypothetical protein
MQLLLLPAQPGLRMQVEAGADIQPGSGLNRLAFSAFTLHEMEELLYLSAQPHLRALSLSIQASAYPFSIEDENSVLQGSSIAACLGQLTGLTQFALWQVPSGLGQLSRLRQLLDLSWDSSEVPLADVLQLSTLTQLTGLSFYGDGLDDAAAVVLGSVLTRLQRLCLSSDNIVTWSMLPVVGYLTGLRELALRPSAEARLEPGLLQYLSTLSGWTWLYCLRGTVHRTSGSSCWQ